MSVVKGRFIDESTPIKSSSDPVAGEDLARKSYVDSKAASEAASAVAGLDLSGKADLVDGKVPSTQLPSYVDDVVEIDDYASLPAEGETSKIYVTKDTNKTYRWSGSVYVEISASPGSTDEVVEGVTNLYYTDDRAKAVVDAKVIVGPTEIAFGSPDGTTLDRSEFFTYDASIGLMLNVGGQMQTRSAAQGPNDPSAVVINDKVEVLATEVDGSVSKGRITKDTVEARKLTADADYSASMGWDGVDSWMGVSKTENAGNNISMSKIFPHKAQLFTVDVGAGTGPQPIMPVEPYDLAVKKYVDDGLGLKLDASEKGAVNGVAELGADGKVPSSQLSAIAITDTFVVASQAAMLALTAEKGDVAVRTDLNKSLILAGDDPTQLADWQELLSPTDAVQSVNGQTGSVSLDSDDISEGATNLYYTTARAALKQNSLGLGTSSQYLRGDLQWAEVPTTVSIAQTRVVTKAGNDSTGDGSLSKPYLTIAAAMASITDASPTKRYIIKVEAGAYTEGALTLKPNVFVVGDLKEGVRVTASSVAMDSTFSANSGSDNRSGMTRIILTGACNFDWNAVTSAAGKLYFTEVSFSSAVTMNGYNNAIAQAQFDSCQFFGALTISGINVGVFKDNVCYSNITLNQHPNGGMATILNATGGYCGGTLRFNTTVNDFNRRCSGFLRGMFIENLIIDGAVSYCDADLISQGKSSTQKLNGGQLIAMTPKISHDLETQMIKPITTNAHNMGDWGKQWSWLFSYVHASTGSDMYLISYGSSYGADSVGRSIGIYTDGGGLQTNVDGGEIVLETAATSGTGVRGKITLNARLIDCSGKQLKNVADATDLTDAVTLGQVQGSLATWEKATFTLAAQDITNGYVDLADLAKDKSTILKSGGVVHEEGATESYTVSTVGGVSRITFLNDLVTGSSALIAGDKVYVQYQK